MPTLVLWVVGLLAVTVACVWLLVLPFRLTKGLMHKWGYHRHCGIYCEQFQQGRTIAAHLDDQFATGLRSGLRFAEQSGVAEAVKTLHDNDLFNQIVGEYTGDDRVGRMVARYNRIAKMTDVRDDPDDWADAYVFALSVHIKGVDDQAAEYDRIVAQLRQIIFGERDDSQVSAEGDSGA